MEFGSIGPTTLVGGKNYLKTIQTRTLLITLHRAFNTDSEVDTMQYVRYMYYHLPAKPNMPSALANPEVV